MNLHFSCGTLGGAPVICISQEIRLCVCLVPKEVAETENFVKLKVVSYHLNNYFRLHVCLSFRTCVCHTLGYYHVNRSRGLINMFLGKAKPSYL